VPPLKKHLYLIDGSGFIFRAFHALPPLTRPDGTPVGAVYGFTNMLIKLLERAAIDADLDYIAVIFDAARKTFRNDIYPEYKAHRPDTPLDLIPQFALVRDATRACNVPAIELPNFEADDLIASYASKAVAGGMDVTVVTGDKDMMQLVGDGIKLFDPIKNKPITETDVMEKFGVAPNRVIDVQSLAGDSSDNVPGVPGIGVKTAAELINHYGDLESLLARAHEIKQPKRREALVNHADDARISKQLVTLKNDVELPMPIDDLIARPIDADMMRNFLAAQGFKTMLAKFGNATPTPTSAHPPLPLLRQDFEGLRRDMLPTVTDHRLIQTESQLTEWLAAMPPFGEIAVDVETDSLSAVSANLVGISLARAPGVACYIPIGHRAPDAGLDFTGSKNAAIVQMPIDVVRRHLAPILQNPAIIKIGHNLKFDRQVMIRYGLDFTPHRDTMLMSYVLDGGKHGHGMDELAKLHLAHDTIKFLDVVGKGKNQITFDLVPLDRAMQYAAEDADLTIRLYHALYPRLAVESCQTIFDVIENPLTPVVADMESAGVLVDRRGLHDLSVEFEKKLLELQGQIHAAAGVEFNIASPKQMGEVLFEKLKLPGGGKTKTGAWSTDVEVLENLDAAGHVIAGQILA
jgi:DNA polymerase-1